MKINNRQEEFEKLEKKFAEEQGLPFSKILDEKEIAKALKEEEMKYRKRIFSPVITIWALLSQVLSDNCSCEKTAGKVRAFFTKSRQKKKEVTASAYCQARERLPEGVVSKLAKNIGKQLDGEIEEDKLWKNRRVVIVDGSSLSAADSEANQREYPQPSTQKKGCGFPIVRVVAAFCLATGMVLEMYFGPYEVSERALLRQLYRSLDKNMIILADRGCYSYCEAALLLLLEHDFVIRYKGKETLAREKCNLKKKNDELVTWKMPKRTPEWSSDLSIPQSIKVRKISYRVETPGFRTKEVTIVTSLTDQEEYSFMDIAQLYFARWQIEVNLRTLKTTMKMDVLKGKTPEIVRKEAWAYILAYNLIRRLIYHSATAYQIPVYSISFRSAQNSILCFLEQMRFSSSFLRQFLFDAMLLDISKKLLPMREKIRVEPRRIKRRMKRFTLLTQPRHYYQNLILLGLYSDRK